VTARPPVSETSHRIRVPWKAIAAELRAAIARGDDDERPELPSALRLAEKHHVGLGTARKALRSLVDEGLAVASGQAGTLSRPPSAAYR